MQRKNIKIGIIAVLVGLIIGLSASPLVGKANIFENVTNFLKRHIQTSTSTQVESEPVSPYKSKVGYESAVIDAVDKASPSVVSIVITKDVPKIETHRLPREFQRFFGNDFKIKRPSNETKEKKIGGSTGFIASSDGMIITNKHVVADKKADYTVLTNDGKKYEAKVLARDPVQDIAILKIDANNLKPAELGNSDSIKIGQTAIAIGNALGEFRNTVSVGVVSGLSRSITASGHGFTERIENVIQTDAAINQGNSGGPLLNLQGEVIGMNTAVAQGAQGIGFALPINRVRNDIQSVKKTGEIKTPFLGVRYRMITSELAGNQDLPAEQGALVRGTAEGPAVLPDSPAGKAGIKAEDIILSVFGEKATLEKTLGHLIQKYNVGETVSLKVLRDGEKLTLEATLAERPEL